MAKDQISLDYETFSETELFDVGSSNYSRHKSTEVLMGAYQLNDNPIIQWSAAEGQPMPQELSEAMDSPDVEKWAFNAAFEVNITRHVLHREVDITQWRDTMIAALHCSFPGSLEKAGQAIGLPHDKQKGAAGKRLINKFSKMQKSRKKADKGKLFRLHWHDDPADWARYLDYNRGDVVAEFAIKQKLRNFQVPKHEWELWHLDQKINEKGLPINLKMVENADKIYKEAFALAMDEMRELTSLDNPNSGPQLLPWLQKKGYVFDDLKKGHVERSLEWFDECPESMTEEEHAAYCVNDDLRVVLALRVGTAKASLKKYAKLLDATGADGFLRYVLQFMGAARTARWAGRLFQPQNLPRPDKEFEKEIEQHAKRVEVLDRRGLELIYGEVHPVLVAAIRPAARAPDGFVFIDADLNAIENRVLGWISDCQKILDVFRNGRCPYVDFATHMFGGNYDDLYAEYRGGDTTKRTTSKPGVLGCGYMLGAGKQFENRQTGEMEATGLLGYAWNMGLKKFTMAESEKSVKVFRSTFEDVVDYWADIQKAVNLCVKTGRPQVCGVVTMDIKAPFLRIHLPSGRCLHYFKPRFERCSVPWKNKDGSQATKMAVTYMGVNERKQWIRMGAHPGKWTENVDQAIARDLLAHGMVLADDAGIDIRLHVHDEHLALAPEDKAEEQLKILIACMAESPSWAGGLPLAAEGYVSKVFKKD